MTISDRIRVKNVRLLSDNHYTLKTTTFEWRRADGEWQTQHRETYDRGNGATLLPYNLARRTVVLVKQFRYPAYVNGYDDLMIEAAAGLLDNESPEKRIRAEAEEEIGYRLHDIRKIFEAFMSPGSVTEKLHFFVGEYEPDMKIGDGGGNRRRGRGHRGAGACDRRGARHDRRRAHRGRQDDHAAAICGAEYFRMSVSDRTASQ